MPEAQPTNHTPTRRPDRRVVRTRAAIDRAFRDLLATTPYEKITVSAIARRANINRKTFYLHYSSVDDLLVHIIEKAVINAAESADFHIGTAHTPADLKNLTKTIIVELIQSPGVNSRIAEGIPVRKVLELARKPLERILEQHRREMGLPQVPHIDYYLTCYMGCIVTAYIHWAEKEEPRESIDELCEIIYEVISGQSLGIL